MINKRGLSDVVTTLIIVLLSIVAIGVVWVVIQNIISESQENISLVGLTLNLEIRDASSTEDNLEVTVRRGSGEGELVGINFIISDDLNSDVIRKTGSMNQLEVKSFDFTLSVLDVDDITEVSIAPVYLSPSGREVIGKITDTIRFNVGVLGSGGGQGAGENDDNDNGIPDDEEGGGGAVCGNDIIESGEQCDDGNTISSDGCSSTCQNEGEECVPTLSCDEFQCGVDSCGNPCGTCDEGFTCGEDQLCYDNNCEDEDPLVTCEGLQCGNVANNCGNFVECGTCSPGENCEENICVEILPFENGTIDNVWPPGVGIYFDSDDLTKTDSLHYSNFVSFPTVDTTRCFTIIGYDYDPSVYPNVIVELFLNESLAISTGNEYYIWGDNVACRASLS